MLGTALDALSASAEYTVTEGIAGFAFANTTQ